MRMQSCNCKYMRHEIHHKWTDICDSNRCCRNCAAPASPVFRPISIHHILCDLVGPKLHLRARQRFHTVAVVPLMDSFRIHHHFSHSLHIQTGPQIVPNVIPFADRIVTVLIHPDADHNPFSAIRLRLNTSARSVAVIPLAALPQIALLAAAARKGRKHRHAVVDLTVPDGHRRLSRRSLCVVRALQ